MRAPDAVSAIDWVTLRRLLAEALILQDAAEDLLDTLHAHPDPWATGPSPSSPAPHW